MKKKRNNDFFSSVTSRAAQRLGPAIAPTDHRIFISTLFLVFMGMDAQQWDL
jgi:hypothetical protein